MRRFLVFVQVALYRMSTGLSPVLFALATVNPCLLVPVALGAACVLAHVPIVVDVGTVVLSALVAVRWWQRSREGVVLELRPRAETDFELLSWVAFFQSAYGIVRPWWKHWLLGQPWVAFEFLNDGAHVVARCWVPPELRGMVTTLMKSATPGLEITEADPSQPLRGAASRARLRLWRHSLFSLGHPRMDALRPTLSALATAPGGQVQVVIRPDTGWQRRAVRRLHREMGNPVPPSLPVAVLLGLGRAVGVVLVALLGPDEARRQHRPPRPIKPLPTDTKASASGYRTEVRLRIAAPTSGIARRHMQTITSTFRALDGPNGLRSRRVWLRDLFDAAMLRYQPPRPWAPVLTPAELAELFHLPVPGSPLEVAPARLAPVRLPAAPDKIICVADDEHGSPAGIWQTDARQHMHLLGPTGSGKSTLLINLALADVLAGRGVAVLDPKGDLIRDLLARIPREEWDRVRLIDPSLTERPVGINFLECEDPELRELVTDQCVTVFRRVYERYWGPRSDDVLRAALMTLLHQRGVTLCEVPLLLLHPDAWRHVIGRVNDPVGLGPWWEEYGRLTEAQRLNMTGSLLYKLRSVLLRPSFRNMVGQAESTIHLDEVMDRGGILLVNLAKGLLGEETSRLLGSSMVARIWQTALARASRPEEWRPDFTVYADEFQNYLNLPGSLGEVLAESRGYHVAWGLANQLMGQLLPPVREALTANARTRVVFQAGADDARHLAREFDPLTERDLRNLQRHQVAVRLCVDGRTDPPFTGMTVPAPPSLGGEHAAELVEHALSRFGRPRAEVEREIVARLRSEGLDDGNDDDRVEWQ